MIIKIDNPVTRIFQLLLLFSPICVGANINMEQFDLVFFRTGIIILFMAALIDTPKRPMPDYVNKIVFSLLGICVWNLFVHNFAQHILANTMNLFLSIVGLYIVYTYIDGTKNLTKYIFWGAGINLFFCIVQRLGFNPIFEQTPFNNKLLSGGFFGNNARLANYFTLIVPFLPFVWLPIGLLLFLVTKQMVILIPVVIILFIRLKDNKLRLGFLAILILLSVLFKEHIIHSLHTRLNVWMPALKAYFDRPLVGFGIGARIFPDTDAYFNSYLSLIIGVGFLGLVWFCYVFKSIYKKLSRNKESIAFITLALLMLVEYPIESIRLWLTIIFIITMAILHFKKEETL